jgi:uncharacterized membrane protein YgcG
VAHDATATTTPLRRATLIRGSLMAIVAIMALLVFALPRKPAPPPSLAHPDQAFVDRAGIVSPDFARQWAGALLDDDRAQIVVFVDRKPPQGELAAWAIQTASDWKVGAAKDDTGLVVFVFTEPRLARIDVGYGLEDRLTDARVHQLLETHLVPAFARGDYERGFDALIFGLRKELGGDDAESIHARAAEARKRADVPWFSQVGPAFARVPRVVAGTVDTFRVEGPATRIPILVAASVILAIAACGVAMAANTVWKVVKLPATIQSRKAGGMGVATAASVFEIAMGVAGFLICLTLVMLVLLAAGSFFTRQGSFSGAGAVVMWPALPR